MDLDAVYSQIAKYLMPVLMAIGGWFCRDIITAQKQTDTKLHKIEIDFMGYKLETSQTFMTKNEHREELKRVHERLDMLQEKLDGLPLAILNTMKSRKGSYHDLDD